MAWEGMDFRDNENPSRKVFAISGKGSRKREGDFLNNKLGGAQGPGVRRQDLTGTPRPEGRRDYSVVPNGGL